MTQVSFHQSFHQHSLVPRPITRTSNHRIRALLVLLTMLALGLSAGLSAQVSDQQEVLLSTQIAEEHFHYDGALRRAIRGAVDSLGDYTVAPRYSTLDWRDEDARTRLLGQAAGANLPVLVTAELRFPGRGRAELDVAFTQTANDRPLLTRNYDFRYRSLPALMAAIEYEVSHDLKRQFSEVGQIIRLDGNRVFIDIGSHSGLQEGDIHRVYDRSERLTNRRGDFYGNLDTPKGLIVIRQVSGPYAIADILFGRQNIEADHWTELVAEHDSDHTGQVLAMLDGEVAVSLGRDSGIHIGDELTVRKTIEQIDHQNAFEVELARIRITEVNADYALGVILRSNQYALARGLIQTGDEVREADNASATVHVNLNRLWFDMTGPDSQSVYTLGFRFDSLRNQQVMYRLTAGYLDTLYLAAGLMGAVNHSENFYYGLDAVATGDTLESIGANAFVSMNAPIPLTGHLRLNAEIGYLMSQQEERNGLNISLGLNILAPGR